MAIYEVTTYETWVRTIRVEADSANEAENKAFGFDKDGNPGKYELSETFNYVDTDDVEVEREEE